MASGKTETGGKMAFPFAIRHSPLRSGHMRIGIFGGTFDPVHLGHLIIAEQAREQAHLDQVWFVPSARPPHKLETPITPFDRRAEMLQLAVAGQPNFLVDLIEKERPGLSSPSTPWPTYIGSASATIIS
jgi:cytidyltransferase-like protein